MSKDTELADIINLHKEWLRSANKSGKRADLSGARLDGVDLSNVDLSGALFRGASLVGTNLKASKLFHADFSDASLKNADLAGATLVLADFTGADLSEANLAGTRDASETEFGQNKRGPCFKDAYLVGANLSSSWCMASDFDGANLQGADFRDALLEQANFAGNNMSGLNMSGANLVDAKLHGSILVETCLLGAKLKGADLRNANLSHANVQLANLTSANLENCKLDGIRYGRQTLFRGIRLEGCYGSSRFKRFAEDQDYIEEFKEAHPLSYLVWLSLTDCGRSMIRVALWSFAISIFFGLAYFSLGPHAFEISNPNGLQWTVFTSIYYSVVTFTTLGFGDVTPNTPLAASMVILEVVIGYVMLGILISILATKVARRS